MTDRVNLLKEIIRYGTQAYITIPRNVFNPKDPQFTTFQESLKELQKDPDLIISIRERPLLIDPSKPCPVNLNYYTDIIITRKQGDNI